MGVLHPIAEIQMEKKMDHEMETKVMGPLSLGTSFILWALNPKPLGLGLYCGYIGVILG